MEIRIYCVRCDQYVHTFCTLVNLVDIPTTPFLVGFGLEIGLLLGWNAAGGTNSYWSYPPAKFMPSTAMLDIESLETGGSGANYQPADLVLMSDPLEWAIYSILARLLILYASRRVTKSR
ncbi:hypothetical protein BDQ94DRAFT_32838, partial [Aspergillus welwitschiae]